jgi:virginiamycin B lyase
MTYKTLAAIAAGTLGLLALSFGTGVSGQTSESGAAGTIIGTVKDPSGAPFKGAYVKARSTAPVKITITVLTDRNGRYTLDELPPGSYEVWASLPGFESDRQTRATGPTTRAAAANFALRKVPVKWSELTHYQAYQLLPKGEGGGKDTLFGNRCFICHGIQNRILAKRMTEAGWTNAINGMRTRMKNRLENQLNDKQAADLISYLTTTFGVDSTLPKSPDDLSTYKSLVRTFSDDSMKIKYVEYDLPYNRIPFSAYPDKDGALWIPYYSSQNKIGRLDPRTGTVQDFEIPTVGVGGIHSAVPAPDGSVWIAEQLTNQLGKLDPRTGKVTQYSDEVKRGQKHTIRVGPQGYVWGTGAPLTRFDPKTETFKKFDDIAFAYDVDFDRVENAWATLSFANQIAFIDAKTDQVTKIESPTKSSYPRRLRIARDGIVWFTEYDSGKIGRYDPATKAFKEYNLPGPTNPGPYALGLDRDGYLWYNADYLDTLGRLDPKTGTIVEYPFPYSGNMIKEFILDAEGRLWFGSTENDNVGYVIVRK